MALDVVNLFVEGTAGYDSNPALEADPEGSGFFVYAGGFGKYFRLTDQLTLDTFLNGRYQDYWQVGDNYDAKVGGTLSYSLADGRFTPAILLEAAAWRDHLVTAAERNEVTAGLAADLVLSNRINLRLQNTWNRQNYLNWAQPFSGRGQGRPIQGKGGAGRSSPGQTDFEIAPPGKGSGEKGSGGKYSCGPKSILNDYLPPRDNLLVETALTLDLFFLPSLTGSLRGGYGVLNSSVDLESYRRIETGISLLWEPFDQWQFIGEAGWYRMNYHHIPDSMEKCVRDINTIYSLGVQIIHSWGPLGIFAGGTILNGEAPLDFESYSQTVVQCGLSWSF